MLSRHGGTPRGQPETGCSQYLQHQPQIVKAKLDTPDCALSPAAESIEEKTNRTPVFGLTKPDSVETRCPSSSYLSVGRSWENVLR